MVVVLSGVPILASSSASGSGVPLRAAVAAFDPLVVIGLGSFLPWRPRPQLLDPLLSMVASSTHRASFVVRSVAVLAPRPRRVLVADFLPSKLLRHSLEGIMGLYKH